LLNGEVREPVKGRTTGPAAPGFPKWKCAAVGSPDSPE